MTLTFPTIIRIFIPFAFGYFLSYLYRVVNAVIAPDLVADLSLDPSTLGMLTGIYFISFASFQLPLGILLDRYGPRKVEAILLLFASLGAFVFSRAENLSLLIIGRALIGFGVSACLMAAFKAYTLWFSKDKWPLVNGFQMAAGGLGAVAATTPVEAGLQFTDWRGIFFILAVVTFLCSVFLFLTVPEREVRQKGEDFKVQLLSIWEIFTSRPFLAIAPLTTLSQATFLSIQGLWAGPWLSNVAGLPRAEVANTLFLMAVAMIAGFIFLGSLAQRLSAKGISVAITAVSVMTVFMVIQVLVIFLPVRFTFILWLSFGFFGTSGIISYAALSQAFPSHLSGRVTTTINLLVFVAAFFSQWFIGVVIDFFNTDQGITLSPLGFRYGFGFLLVLEFVGLGIFLLLTSKRLDVGNARA